MGDQGTLVISEASGRGEAYREPTAPQWDEWVKKGYLLAPPEKKEEKSDSVRIVDVRESPVPDMYKIGVDIQGPVSQAASGEFLQRDSRQRETKLPG